MKSLSNFGVVTQCLCPVKITERYLTNVLLKINAKVSLTWLAENGGDVPRV